MFCVSSCHFLRRTDHLSEATNSSTSWSSKYLFSVTHSWCTNRVHLNKWFELCWGSSNQLYVCLCALAVANMGQECAVPVRSHHDRHNSLKKHDCYVDKMNVRWPRIYNVDRICFCLYKFRLFCPQSEKCNQPFVHKMKGAVVNSVQDMNHPFRFLCMKDCALFNI